MHFTFGSQDRVLGAALGLSLALHAALLSVHFKFPDASRWKSSNASIEVVLVNAKTRERPAKAEALAQANLNRGGTVEENRRAKTPLPVTEPRQPGKDLAEAQRRQRSLEAQQAELLAKARDAQARVPATAERQPEIDNPGTKPSGRDLADLALAAMRLQAQIDRQIDEYQKRPRKKFIGAQHRRVPLRAVRRGLARQDRAHRHAQLSAGGARPRLRQPAPDGQRSGPTATSSRSSSTAPRASRCSTPRRSRSCAWRRRSPPFRPTSGATPTCWSSRERGSSARATRSGLNNP